MASRSGTIVRTLLLLLILAGTLPFFFPLGHPLLSWKSLSMPELPELPDSLPSLPASEKPESRPVTVYRWQDTQGGWHFSSEAPQEGVSYERMSVDPDTNLIAAQPAEKQPPSAPAENAVQAADEGFSYSAEDIRRLKEKAREARDKMEQHYKEQEELLRQ